MAAFFYCSIKLGQPMPIFFRDISSRPIFTWTLWNSSERKWYKTFPTAKKKQMERWHLREFQQPRRVDRLAHWLASHLAHVDPSVMVRVESIWVDHTPQAQASCIDPITGSQVSAKCELADLLLVVDVKPTAQPHGPSMSRRAMLIQSKVTDRTDRLDPAPHDASTVEERNLLECCQGPITVRTGTAVHSRTLARSPYTIAAPATPGLMDYAAYQLTPRQRPAYPLLSPPYQALWPTSRAFNQGINDPFEKVLLEMSGLYPAKAGANLLAPAPQGWIDLVDDLLNGYRHGFIHRFVKKTRSPIPRICDSGYWHKFSIIGSVLGPTLQAISLASIWKYIPFASPKAYVVPQEGMKHEGPPDLPGDDGDQAGMPHIPTLIVTIRTDKLPQYLEDE